MPAVQADGAVEPKRVVQAEAGERRERGAVRVGAQDHVQQQVVAGIRKQGGMQERVVADIAWQAHPVGAGSLRGRPTHEVRWFVHADLEGRRLLYPAETDQTLLRGEVTDPLLHERKPIRSGIGWGRLTEPGLWRAVVERKDRNEELPLSLRDRHAPGGDRTSVAYPIDEHIDRLTRNPRLDEIRVQ